MSHQDHEQLCRLIVHSLVSEGHLNGLRHEIAAIVRKDFLELAKNGEKVTKLNEELEIERRIGQRIGFRAHCLASGILEATGTMDAARASAVATQEAEPSPASEPAPPTPGRSLRANLMRLVRGGAEQAPDSPEAA